MSPDDQRITRDQIEAKLRDVTGGVSEEVEEVKSQALAVGVAVVMVSIVVVYLFGRRRGRRRSTVVEVRRL